MPALAIQITFAVAAALSSPFGAVVMAVRQPFTRGEQAVWIALAGLLFVFEVKSIYSDRRRYESESREARKTLNAEFDKILTEHRSSMAQTMDRMRTLSELSVTNLNTVLGGDSFCYLVITLTDKTGGYPLAGNLLYTNPPNMPMAHVK